MSEKLKMTRGSGNVFLDLGFGKAEAEVWLAQPYAREGIHLRHWDDTAKDPAARTPSLDHFLDIAETVMK